MKSERRQLTRREWAEITSKRPVVRRILPPTKPKKENVLEGRTLERRAGNLQHD